jgi:hypothetical protein
MQIETLALRHQIHAQSLGTRRQHRRLVPFRARLFSVTVRTTLSGAPDGSAASDSRVTLTFAPGMG